MPVLDFKEIAQSNSSDGNQDCFELFSREFLQLFGYEVVSGPDRGQDAGRDLIVVDQRTDIDGTVRQRWLVSCKHYAPSGRAVGKGDELDVSDRIRAHDCEGFIGVYSTLPSASLTQKLRSLGVRFRVFDREQIEDKLLASDRGLSIARRYFPLSISGWASESRPDLPSELDSLYSEYRIQMLTPAFFVKLLLEEHSPDHFYRFSEPSWLDIVNNLDIVRSDQIAVLEKLISLGSGTWFLPILAPSGEGKSTFLRRLSHTLVHQDENVLYLDSSPSVMEVDRRRLVEALAEFSTQTKRRFYLVVDDCFRFAVDYLVPGVAANLIDCVIIGSSQVREYRQEVERYRETVLFEDQPFHLSSWSESELSNLMGRMQATSKSLVEARHSAGVELCPENDIVLKYREKRQLMDVILQLMPESRITTRVAELVDSIKTSDLAYKSFKMICLSFQLGLSMPLPILRRICQASLGLKMSLAEEDVVYEMNKVANGESVVEKLDENFFALKVRHERWAAEAVSLIFYRGVGMLSGYREILAQVSCESEVECRYAIRLVGRLIEHGEIAISKELHRSWHIPVPETLQDNLRWLRIVDDLGVLKLADIGNLIELLEKFTHARPSDPDPFFKWKYLCFLIKRYSEVSVIAKKMYEPSTFVDRPVDDSEDFFEFTLQRLSQSPRFGIPTYLEQLIAHGRYDQTRHILESLEVPVEERYAYRKLECYFEHGEFERALDFWKQANKLWIRYRKMYPLYIRLLTYADRESAEEHIERLAEKKPERGFVLKLELFIVHSMVPQIKQLLGQDRPKKRANERYIWYLAALAKLGEENVLRQGLGFILAQDFSAGGHLNNPYSCEALFALATNLQSNERNAYIRLKILFLAKEVAKRNKQYALRVRNELTSDLSRLISRWEISEDRLTYAISLRKIIKDEDIGISQSLKEKLAELIAEFCLSQLETEPGNRRTLLEYAQALEIQQKFERARQCYLQMITANPDHPESYNSYANFLKSQVKDYDEAKNHYKKALELAQTFYWGDRRLWAKAKYNNNLALSIIESGDESSFDEAEECLVLASQRRDFVYATVNLDRLKELRLASSRHRPEDGSQIDDGNQRNGQDREA